MIGKTRQDRAAAIAEVRHSTTLSGGRSTDEARALQDRYVDGEFDVDELGRRTRALFGVPPQPGDSDYPAAGVDDVVDQGDELVAGLVDHVLPEVLIDTAIGTLTPGPDETEQAS